MHARNSCVERTVRHLIVEARPGDVSQTGMFRWCESRIPATELGPGSRKPNAREAIQAPLHYEGRQTGDRVSTGRRAPILALERIGDGSSESVRVNYRDSSHGRASYRLPFMP